MRNTLEWVCAYLVVIGGVVGIGALGFIAVNAISTRVSGQKPVRRSGAGRQQSVPK